MRKLLLVFLVLCIFDTAAFGDPLAPLSDYQQCSSFVTGEMLFEANRRLADAEAGFFTAVPLDYSHPERGTTQIYAHFPNAYDASRPTFVIFTGGPGQSSHLQSSSKFGFYEGLGYNLLIFDQRGIGFSRVATAELARPAKLQFGSNCAGRRFDNEQAGDSKNLGLWGFLRYGASDNVCEPIPRKNQRPRS